MGLLANVKSSMGRLTELFSSDTEPKTIGIYGPPNAGKSTLANRLLADWADGDFNPVAETDLDADAVETDGGAVAAGDHSVSEIPHETRRAVRREGVTIERDGTSVDIDIVDTPGVDTKVDHTEFFDYGMDEEDAIDRSREATEGIAEAMHWLKEDIDGVIYVLDSTKDPFTQTNTMIIGIIESQDLPVVILSNKLDRDDANVTQIENAFPQHDTVPVSVLNGDNMEAAYDKFAEHFA